MFLSNEYSPTQLLEYLQLRRFVENPNYESTESKMHNMSKLAIYASFCVTSYLSKFLRKLRNTVRKTYYIALRTVL